MLLEDSVKTATAARSPEIFLVVGNTGFFSPQLLCSSRLFEADPSPGLWPAAVWPKRIESNFSRCAATHPPEGKATHCILSRLRLLTARLSATHNNLSVASLLQIVFAAVTAVRCAPLTRSPLPCKQGRANFCGEAAGPQCFTQLPDVRDHPAPVISSGGKGTGFVRSRQATENPVTRFPSGGIMLHEDTAKITTASRSREIFLVVGNTGFSPPQLLRSSRLCEADPSPSLWPSPFSKGELAYGYFSIMR